MHTVINTTLCQTLSIVLHVAREINTVLQGVFDIAVGIQTHGRRARTHGQQRVSTIKMPGAGASTVLLTIMQCAGHPLAMNETTATTNKRGHALLANTYCTRETSSCLDGSGLRREAGAPKPRPTQTRPAPAAFPFDTATLQTVLFQASVAHWRLHVRPVEPALCLCVERHRGQVWALH